MGSDDSRYRRPFAKGRSGGSHCGQRQTRWSRWLTSHTTHWLWSTSGRCQKGLLTPEGTAAGFAATW